MLRFHLGQRQPGPGFNHPEFRRHIHRRHAERQVLEQHGVRQIVPVVLLDSHAVFFGVFGKLPGVFPIEVADIFCQPGQSPSLPDHKLGRLQALAFHERDQAVHEIAEGADRSQTAVGLFGTRLVPDLR